MDEKHHLAKVRSRVRIPSSLSVRSNGPGEGWVQSEGRDFNPRHVAAASLRCRLRRPPKRFRRTRGACLWLAARTAVGAIKRAWLVVEDCGGCDAVYVSTPSATADLIIEAAESPQRGGWLPCPLQSGVPARAAL